MVRHVIRVLASASILLTCCLFNRCSGSKQHINPCPGLVVDASAGNRSITNVTINEFYLNSHATIQVRRVSSFTRRTCCHRESFYESLTLQGTAKPCKYALIFDEIGFKISELELLTYWTTYLYARCNKSVSYATPAYYAHWASKRAKGKSHAS